MPAANRLAGRRACREPRIVVSALLLVMDDPPRLRRRGACLLSPGFRRWGGTLVVLNRQCRQSRSAHAKPRGAEGVALVHHEKERRQLGPMFASSPAPRQLVGRGHRRGLDGPTMPHYSKKMGLFFSTHRGVPAAGWAGACFAGGCATSWAPAAWHTKVQDAAKPSLPRSEVDRTPKEIAAVQARFQMAARRRNKPLPTLPPRPCTPGSRARSARQSATGNERWETDCSAE